MSEKVEVMVRPVEKKSIERAATHAQSGGISQWARDVLLAAARAELAAPMTGFLRDPAP